MTSLAFIFGCIPLWTATGAGAVARQIMGTTVIGGMLAASCIGIFFIRRSSTSLRNGLGAGKEVASSSLPTTPAAEMGD